MKSPEDAKVLMRELGVDPEKLGILTALFTYPFEPFKIKHSGLSLP